MNRQKRPGGRGGGRGGRGGSRPSHPRVPPSRSINPGTSVNIVLKVDQPTGRTVSGTVSEVLTRGDHPRGVKVRLVDGRVGRVQSLRSGEETQVEFDKGVEGLQDGEDGIQLRTQGGDLSGRRNRFTSRDMRLDEPDEPSSEPLGLDSYIRPAKGKKRGGNAKSQAQHNMDGRENDIIETNAAAEDTATVKCPVCPEFEGDEAAVAHHVAGHFGE
ncbi:uncharacterized protein N7469_011566 [Penicillium citrinum]|uniref:UBZ4-type domain-containing protein n=1 Tax=Penicillium citrinum TaxID=5077 RepID=A0A9W9NBA5_PENCI|nr:uncharacterized protein N7469_011566 [Penicillium citrinum]KAJ5216701.1 hypothetical protein N7469_011566 [Penicillium citrinum]